jgi:hypothetical protein
MTEDFTRFLNDRKWTTLEFKNEERIKCNLLITITAMPTIGTFEASAQIISARPVFGTDYETVLLNFGDRDWSFSYLTSRPLQFNENSFTDNITSILAFYAYLIIALDFDSFAEMSGDPYYQKAFQIMNNAQQSNYPGWQQFGSTRNRYWLIENFMNASLQPIRRAFIHTTVRGWIVTRKNRTTQEISLPQASKTSRKQIAPARARSLP